MSLEQAIEGWFQEYHPKVLSGITKVITKQNKQGKKIQQTVTEKDPLIELVITLVSTGTIELLTTGRVLFPLTRHESLCSYDQITNYINGKSYKRALKQSENQDVDWSIYEPHITPHKSVPHLLFCVLTSKHLNKDRAEVEAHIKGAAYQRGLKAVQEFNQKQADKLEKIRLAKKSRRELVNKFNTPGTSDDKYDFSNLDLGAMMNNFDDEFDGEGEFDGEELFFDDDGEGELDDMLFEDEDFEFDEIEDIPQPTTTTQSTTKSNKKTTTTPAIEVLDLSKKTSTTKTITEPVKQSTTTVTKGTKVDVKSTKTPAPTPAAPITTKSTKQQAANVQIIDDGEDDEDEEMMNFEDDEFPFDMDMDDFGEGELPGMFDGEGEFIPGIYDGEGEFIPGLLRPDGTFIPFDMLDGEGEFDSQSFFDQGEDFDEDDYNEDDDEDDYDVTVFDEYGNMDFEDEDEDDDEDMEFISDHDDDEVDDESTKFLSSFAKLKQQREKEMMKASIQPATATKRKAEEQINNRNNNKKQQHVPPTPPPTTKGKADTKKGKQQPHQSPAPVSKSTKKAPTPVKAQTPVKADDKKMVQLTPPKRPLTRNQLRLLEQQQQQQQQQAANGQPSPKGKPSPKPQGKTTKRR